MSRLEAFRMRLKGVKVIRPTPKFKEMPKTCEYGHDWDEGQYGVKKCKTCRRYKV